MLDWAGPHLSACRTALLCKAVLCLLLASASQAATTSQSSNLEVRPLTLEKAEDRLIELTFEMVGCSEEPGTDCNPYVLSCNLEDNGRPSITLRLYKVGYLALTKLIAVSNNNPVLKSGSTEIAFSLIKAERGEAEGDWHLTSDIGIQEGADFYKMLHANNPLRIGHDGFLNFDMLRTDRNGTDLVNLFVNTCAPETIGN